MMEHSEIIAAVAIIAGLIGSFIPRFFQKSDERADLVVRQAVFNEKLSQHQDRIAVLEQHQKALWRELDKLKDNFHDYS